MTPEEQDHWDDVHHAQKDEEDLKDWEISGPFPHDTIEESRGER